MGSPQLTKLLFPNTLLKSRQHLLKLANSAVSINTRKTNYYTSQIQIITRNMFLKKNKHFFTEIFKKMFINKHFVLNKESVFITPLKSRTYYSKYNSKLITT